MGVEFEGMGMTEFVSKLAKACDRHGEYIARQWALPGGGSIVSACPGCRDEATAAESRAKSGTALFAFKLALAAAGIGPRYYEASFDNYRVSRDEESYALQSFRNYTQTFDRRRSKNLVVYGHTGTGKTHLACAMAKVLLMQGISVSYLPILNLFSQYQDITSYNSEREGSREGFFVKMRAPDLLIIDEFGIVALTEKERIVLHRVIDERYNRRAPTCLIGNSSLPEFAEIVGERAMRRVMSETVVVACDWSSAPTNSELFAEGE